MRIALITPEYPGCGPSFGVGRYVADLAHGLAAAGHEARVIAATDVASFIIDPGCTPVPRARGVPHLLLRPGLARSFLEQELDAFQPEVVDLPNWGGLGAFLRLGCPMLVRLVTSAADPSHGRWGLRTPLRLATERRTVRRAALVVADSHGMAATGLRLYHRAVDAVTYLAHTGPIREIQPRSQPEVLFVGRLEARKGIDVLLDAWSRVRAQIPAARLHVVGKDQGGYTARAQGVPGVVIHGRLDDQALADLRRTCLVQAIPSRFESFGLVALEAWADGLAVVGSRTGGLTEVIGDAGLLVPSADDKALAAALVQALDPDAALAWATRGRERLLAHFLPGPWIETTLGQYRRLAEGAAH
jgi:glycogen(starch) synthase